MASVTTTSSQRDSRVAVPQLASGDHLTRAEFERRYAAMPEGMKAELIEGVVYMAPPVRYKSHSQPHSILNGWLLYYVSKTPGLGPPGNNASVRFDEENSLQPDVFLVLPPRLGGRAHADANDYLIGAPALVCEIAASSVSIDMYDKKDVYRRRGVQEYLVWRTEDAAVDWFSLEAGEYVPLPPQTDGTLCSKTFPGLCVHPSSLLSADLPAIFALLDKSVETPEHEGFVRRLGVP